MYYHLWNFMEHYSKDMPLCIMEIGEELCEKNYNISRKISPIYILEFIVSGNNKYIINDIEAVANIGDVAFIPKNSCHNYMEYTNTCKKIWCVFDGSIVEHFANIYLPINQFIFHCPELITEFDNILNIATQNTDNFDTLNRMLSLVIFDIFIKLHTLSSLPSLFTIEQKIMKKIDDNISKPFSLEQLSDEFKYSKNHIILLFKKKFGITPNKYYMSKKIDIACLYLANTIYSISDISDKLGFADQHYFANSFFAKMNKTPSRYRHSLNNTTMD